MVRHCLVPARKESLRQPLTIEERRQRAARAYARTDLKLDAEAKGMTNQEKAEFVRSNIEEKTRRVLEATKGAVYRSGDEGYTPKPDERFSH